MFDFGFSELMVVGVVGLVVLGPEKLPVVAKTAGQWLGKAQRMVQQVKSDIEREAELSELKKIQQEAKSVADDITKTVKGQVDALQSDMNSLTGEVNAAAQEMSDSFSSAVEQARPKGSSESSESDDVAQTPDPSDDFYGWYGAETAVEDGGVKTTFEKRYKCGPSIDELAEQIERLKAELGDRSPQLGGSNRRLATRARSNRVRIYR